MFFCLTKGSLIINAGFVIAVPKYSSKPLSESIATIFKLICKPGECYNK